MAGLTPKQRDKIDEILGGADDVKIIPWPKRPGVKIGMRLLGDDEMREADEVTREWAESQKLDTGIARHRDNEFAAYYAGEVLFRALVTSDESHQPIARSPDSLRRRPRQELNVLLGAYNDFARDMLADPDALSDDQLADLLEKIRGPFEVAEATLLRLAPVTLRRLLHFTVSPPSASTGSAS
jgi:hypothetical protein